MRLRSPRPLIAAALALVTVAGTAGAYAVTAQPASAPVTVSVTTLHFKVTVGPDGSVCDIVGDLYRPSTATAQHPAPAILTTNGFGGSKADQAYLGEAAGKLGYVTLSYSGLGFGGSGCQITLDDPSYDGVAASQLISFLGGASGIAYTDAGHTAAYPAVTFVARDVKAHDGKRYANDPRVGMVGGSYGGEIQFAAAGVDPRLDAIVPMITWNDLSYSLAPNNTDFYRGVSSRTPGVLKMDWPLLFSALGMADGVEGAQADPSRLAPCPNFAWPVCPSLVSAIALGYATEPTIDFLRHASVTTYLSKIRIPTLLMQGQNDTLFDLQEAAATYQALKSQGTPVSMVWQSWGHSDGTPAKGEFASDGSVFSTYEGQRILAWFDHYLKGLPVSTGPAFAYYRDWVPFSGSGPDTVQYGTAPAYPVGGPVTAYLSGSSSLVFGQAQVQSGTTPVAALPLVPTSYSETSEFQSQLPDGLPPATDAPGTSASWTTAPLASPLDVVGIPTALLHVTSAAALTQYAGPAGMLTFYAKVYDVAPDGTATLINRLVSAVRVSDASQPVTVQLPGIVHRFAAGHSLRFTVASSDAAFRNATVPQPFLVTTSALAPGTLTLPVVR